MEKLKQVKFNDKVVITSELLAKFYGVKNTNIKQNFNNNKSDFIENEDYFLLKGNVLKNFKRKVDSIDLAKNLNQFYLWTESGALKHCRRLKGK